MEREMDLLKQKNSRYEANLADETKFDDLNHEFNRKSNDFKQQLLNYLQLSEMLMRFTVENWSVALAIII